MTDYDRYDFALSMLVGLIMAGGLLLGGPLWIVPLPLAIGVTITLYRHFDLPPRRIGRNSRST